MNDPFGINNNNNDNDNNNAGGYDNNNAGGYDNNNAGGYDNSNMGGYDNNNMGGYNNNNMGGYDNNNMGGYNNGGGYYQNQQFTGIYNDPNYNQSDERKSAGFAIAAFVIAIVNIFPCCTTLSIISVPLCLIFAIISLVGKRKGTVFAVIGLILSLLSGLLFAYYGFIVYKIMPDFVYFSEHQEQIIDDYDRDGTIPERFEKYRDPKYDKYWERMGYDSFDEFFAKFIEEQKKGMNSVSSSSSSSSRRSSDGSDLALGFVPALII